MLNQEISSAAKNSQSGSESQQESELLNIFFKTMGLDVVRSEIVTIDSSIARNGHQFRQKIAAVSNNANYVITIIDDSKCTKFSKLYNLLLRQKTIRKCTLMMAEANFTDVGNYALYPTVENLSLVYQTNSVAAEYAEKYLLNEKLNLPKRILNYLFKVLNLESPAVDMIAVVGFRSC